MSVISEVTFSGPFMITPECLVDAQKRLPINPDGYIPRGFPREMIDSGNSFTLVLPELTKLGGGLVSMSLDKPFGFMWPIETGLRMPQSQKTNGIKLAPNPDKARSWLATLDTPKALTPDDIKLFDDGIRFYAKCVLKSLRANNA